MPDARRIDRNWYLNYTFALLLVAVALIDCNGRIIRPRNVKTNNASTHLQSFLDALDSLTSKTARNFRCRCDKSCIRYGDCCLNCIFEEDFYTRPPPSVKPTCDSEFSIRTIKQCAPGFNNFTLIKRCVENHANESELVFGNSSGVVYNNAYCAFCNGESTVYPANEEAWKDTRVCTLEPISTCSFPNMTLWGHRLKDLCAIFFSPLTTRNQPNRGISFRNAFCGICNGIALESLVSFRTFSRTLQGKMTHDTREVATRDFVPAAFSILLNFGLDGQERMMYSSENEENMRKYQKLCGHQHIYDPFSGKCRQLFCSSQFTLVNYKCERNTTGNLNDNANNSTSTPPIFDTTSEYVQLKLSLRTSFTGSSVYPQPENFSTFEMDLKNSVSKLYKISPERVRNVSMEVDEDTMLYLISNTPEYFIDKITNSSTAELLEVMSKWNKFLDEKFNLSVQFLLFEPNETMRGEPSTDKIVSQMVFMVSMNTFTFSMNGFDSSVYAINQNIPVVNKWCDTNEGKMKLEYWNEQFHLIVNNSARVVTGIQEVYINVTGKTYSKKQFIANILFQGYDESENVNISGCVIVCEEPSLSDKCERVELDEGTYEILPDLNVKYLGNSSMGLILSNFEFGSNGSIFVCYDKTPGEKWAQERKVIFYDISYDFVQAVVSTVLLCVSIISLSIVLLTYSIFKELRNLPGCNTMNLAFAVLLGHLLFIISQREEVVGWGCKVLGVLVHFFILTSFFWMNVIAYDLYRTFGKNNGLVSIQHNRRLLPLYMLYAYGTPGLVIVFALIQDEYENTFRPMYGFHNNCWIGNSKAAMAFFAAPLGIIIIINLIFYLRTICSISSVHRKIRANCNTTAGRKDVILYTRIAAVMGFTWVFGFLAAYIDRKSDNTVGVLTYLFIVFNTSQGLFIFFAFLFNKRVLILFRNTAKKTRRLKIGGCKKCRHWFCMCGITSGTRDSLQKKNSSGMTRSVSTDTTKTVVQ